jgi:RNA polymerase sigma-70 factor (ECF subfamily)
MDRSLESTAFLLTRVRDGDEAARDRLIARYLPMLREWARGRLPGGARSLADTDDLVQVTLIRALKNLKDFESRGEGAFLRYLRQILLNAMRNEIRRASRRGPHDELGNGIPAVAPSPLESTISRDTMERYETALERLGQEQQEAVILRVEMGYSYDQIAEALGKNSANTARMVVTRALAHLAMAMDG